uniref:Uncharacterized protein n=1 Tax=Fibrocapsa japonica TaxID=94617 RepID=A0A6U1NZN9_9STRA|mmetsp:Transcript_23826/g.34660  ORF Transcript_23826/g.34660 Transcript_23826/m.34660 type:complete len:199 (+) Transcript_23826:115-711(+)
MAILLSCAKVCFVLSCVILLSSAWQTPLQSSGRLRLSSQHTLNVNKPHRTCKTGSCALEATSVDGLEGIPRLEKFFQDSSLLGAVRFVVVTDGAILETVGSYENMKINDLDKGKFATFKNSDKSFECHVNMDEVAKITMSTKNAKQGDRILYITRFYDNADKLILSSMLHPEEEGNYEDGSVEWWEQLREVFGEDQRL